MTKKTALITGASKRIGRSIALKLAENGYDIAIHYNSSKQEAEKLQKEIEALGQKSDIFACDLSNNKDSLELIPKITEEFSPINCLINNASLFEKDNANEIEIESWNNHLAINLTAPMLLSTQFAKQLAEKPGNIINMLDYCVWKVNEDFLSYSISKNALWHLTQTLALQLAPNIRVNAIGPGHTLPNTRESYEHFEEEYKNTPLQIQNTKEEIANAIIFLLSSPSITGQMLAIDGGKHLSNESFT